MSLGWVSEELDGQGRWVVSDGVVFFKEADIATFHIQPEEHLVSSPMTSAPTRS